MAWVSVATTAVGVIGGAVQGNQSRKAAQGAANNAKWLMPYTKDVLGRATKIADRPYTPYTGQLTAGLSGNEVRAGSLASGPAYQKSQDMLDKAGQQADALAGSEWNAQTAEKYMNPWLEQALAPALRKAKESYQEQSAAIGSNAARMNAFGSDRSAVRQGALDRGYATAVADTTKEAHAQAWDAAMRGWQADQQRRQNAITAYRSVGGDIARLNSQQIGDLLKTGGVEHVTQQLKLDNDYKQFVEQRDWEVNNLEPLMKALSVAQGTNTGGQVPASSAASDILGGAATIIGMLGKEGVIGGGGGGGDYGGWTSGFNSGLSSSVGNDVAGFSPNIGDIPYATPNFGG